MTAMAYQRDERHTITYRLGPRIPIGQLRQALADAEAEHRRMWGGMPLPDDWAWIIAEPDGLAIKFRLDPPPAGPRILDVAATQVMTRIS